MGVNISLQRLLQTKLETPVAWEVILKEATIDDQSIIKRSKSPILRLLANPLVLSFLFLHRRKEVRRSDFYLRVGGFIHGRKLETLMRPVMSMSRVEE